MKILIKVTKEVLERSKMCGIEDGKICHNTNCAIAVAVRDLFPQANVWHYYMHLIERDVLTKVNLPDSATDFINAFDLFNSFQRVLMTPFSFEIEVPEYVINKIGLNQIYKVLSESKTLEHIN